MHTDIYPPNTKTPAERREELRAAQARREAAERQTAEQVVFAFKRVLAKLEGGVR